MWAPRLRVRRPVAPGRGGPARFEEVSVARGFMVVMCLWALVGLTGCTSGTDRARTPAPPSARGIVADLPDVVSRVEPSVVTIRAGGAVGSGVVYREGGVIVTNNHVVDGERQIEVVLVSGEQVPARVVAGDPITDLAVVRAERRTLPPATFQTALPRPGELVLAMGSPLGFENSVTMGIVSGLSRSIPGSVQQTRSLVDLIQTDAPISPGNSGGGLVNARGEIVGINVAYIPPEQRAVSIGFAIPSATVVDTVDELLRTGEATHPYLGIVPSRLTPQIERALGIDVDGGVVVTEVVEDGPAAQAGMRPGDVVTSFAGERIRGLGDFLSALRGLEPGQTVEAEVVRDGRAVRLSVTLGELRS